MNCLTRKKRKEPVSDFTFYVVIRGFLNSFFCKCQIIHYEIVKEHFFRRGFGRCEKLVFFVCTLLLGYLVLIPILSVFLRLEARETLLSGGTVNGGRFPKTYRPQARAFILFVTWHYFTCFLIVIFILTHMCFSGIIFFGVTTDLHC